VRTLFGNLFTGIQQSNKPRAAKKTLRRASLRIEGLETRDLMSATPLLALTPTAASIAHVAPILILDPIQAKYQSLQGVLGPAVSPEMPTPYGGGIYQEFVGGDIFFSPATGAHYFGGDSVGEWELTASEHGANGVVVQKILGLPTTDEAPAPGIQGAFVTHFQGGAIYYSSAIQSGLDSFALYGAIGVEYAHTAFERGGNGEIVQSILGAPTSDERNVPGVPGARVETFQGGAIYWSPATGAHVVYGAIGARYESIGGPIAYGLPISDEANESFVAGGRVSFFQGGRAIYWSQSTGAHLVYGAIEAEYLATANERGGNGEIVKSILGAPTSDEMNVPGVAGARMNTFQGGAIYWSPATGAHVVYGAIGARYAAIGGPAVYGLPVSDEANASFVSGERVSFFQGGRAIYWSASTGAHLVYGAIGEKYLAIAGERDYYGQNVKTILGAPTSDEMNVPGVPGARMNTFQGGVIYWSPSTGAHVVYGGILTKYESIGGPASFLGLPTSDELQYGRHGRISYFQHGRIVFDHTGLHVYAS
jgi:uncharacterized protein with LGFP repeats